MEDHSVVIATLGKLRKVLAGLGTVLVAKSEMDVSHCGLENDFVRLVLRTQLVDNLQFSSVGPFVEDVSYELMVRRFLWQLLGEDVESNLLEGSCVDGRI